MAFDFCEKELVGQKVGIREVEFDLTSGCQSSRNFRAWEITNLFANGNRIATLLLRN